MKISINHETEQVFIDGRLFPYLPLRNDLVAKPTGIPGIWYVMGFCTFTQQGYKTSGIPLNGLLEWAFEGKLIQVALPNVDAQTREFLISGVSPKGWRDMVEHKL